MAVFGLTERSLFQRLGRRSADKSAASAAEIHRLEKRHLDAVVAADHWTSLLRDLEQQGLTADASYERYFRAFLDAKQQVKRTEMDLFNVRLLAQGTDSPSTGR